jgi:hypothetical protein
MYCISLVLQFMSVNCYYLSARLKIKIVMNTPDYRKGWTPYEAKNVVGKIKTTAPRIPAWSPTVVLTGRHSG